MKDVDWDKFSYICSNRLIEIEDQEDGVEEYNSKISTIIHKTATIGKKTTVRKRKAVPWWNEKCGEVIRERNKEFRKVKSSLLYPDLIKYKKAQAIVRKTIRAAKRSYWREYCNNIGWDIQISDIWGMIRRMRGIHKTSVRPVQITM